MSKRIQRIGLEYELEGLPYSSDEYHDNGEYADGWTITHDGTLRGNAAEFVSQPTPLTEAPELVESLLEFIGGEYENSHRCSQHIHVSIDDLRRWQRLAMYMLFVSEEEFFFQFDPDRAKNHYCTPLLYTPAFYQGLHLMSQAPDWTDGSPSKRTKTLNIRSPYSTCCKYSSVNAMPALMESIGTIELRHFAPLMRMSEVNAVLDKIQVLTDLAHECPHDKSDKMYEFLLDNSDKVSSPRALEWCVMAVQQIQQDLSGNQTRRPSIQPSVTSDRSDSLFAAIQAAHDGRAPMPPAWAAEPIDDIFDEGED